MQLPQLRMEKSDLERVPDIPTPRGYLLRHYQRGDDAGLARIYGETELADGTVETVMRNIVGNPCFKPERVFIVEHAGEIIGTSAAWIEPDRDPGYGYLHMVGILPAFRGHHLGALLTVEAIRYSRHEGFTAQRLTTDDNRDAAVRLYLDLGYYPIISHESHAERWRVLGEKLNRTEAVARAKSLL